VPAFDAGRYVFTVIMIGVIAGALMYMYDQFAAPFNTLVATGLISVISVQTATVIYYSIVAYAPINLLFATVAALLVANARAEVNSPLIMTDFGPHMVLAVVIICAFAINLLVSGFLDPFVMSISAFSTPPWGSDNILNTMFNAAHLLCVISIGVAYLYMILGSIRIQSLQWSV
jgi:hypothetical protein